MNAPTPARLRRFWTSFGPGLMWAATAIGVSHLVQATRAGAMAGFGLAGIVLAALILKYPFFEFGPRYAAATGTSLLEGYRRIGRWALGTYLAITLATALVIQVAVVMFTSFAVRLALGLTWPLPTVATALSILCVALLVVGRFRLLDRTIKLIVLVLAISTLAAAALAASHADPSTLAIIPRSRGEGAVPFAFVLALAGWMPSGVDISVWSSLWTLAKDRLTGVRADLDTVLLDFRVGYVGTGMLAFAFLLLGAALMFGSGETFSARGTEFTAQLVQLYTRTLGGWTKPIVLTAVVATMFSTMLAVVDGFPRSIDRAVRVAFTGELDGVDVPGVPRYQVAEPGRLFWASMVLLCVGTVLVLAVLPRSLTAMVDFATIVSFLTAPVLGYLNLRAVTGPEVPEEARPGRGLVTLAWTGLLVLGGFAIAYVVSRVG